MKEATAWALGAALFLGGTAAFGQVEKDIPYLEGADLEGADAYRAARCKLDVCHPDGVTDLPVLVWFHGGGLTKGGKGLPFTAAYRQFVQVAVNYRLMGTNGVTSGEAPISDAAAAVAWTLRHIRDYGGDPKKVFVSGSSAGGYLTMMVGMDPKWLAKYDLKTSDLAGLAPSSGQATTHFAVKKFRGDTRPGIVPVIDEYAPLGHVSNWKDIPPIVCISGTPPWEWKGRAEENEFLIGTLKGLGHKQAWYVRLPFANHGRTVIFGKGYIEGFVLGRYPDDLHLVEGEKH